MCACVHVCVCMCTTLRSTINIALLDFTVRQVSFPNCTGMGHTHLPFDIVCLAESEPSHQHVTLCTLLWESEKKEGREGGGRGGEGRGWGEQGRQGGRKRREKGAK